MIERTKNGYIILTETGQRSAREFAQEYGRDNGKNWDFNALYSEVEESINNTVVGETLQYELSGFDSNNGHANLFWPHSDDIKYQPSDD